MDDRFVQPDGAKIRQLRQAHLWSQERLADAAGVRKRTVERAEAGARLQRSSLRALAQALGCAPEALVHPANPSAPPQDRRPGPTAAPGMPLLPSTFASDTVLEPRAGNRAVRRGDEVTSLVSSPMSVDPSPHVVDDGIRDGLPAGVSGPERRQLTVLCGDLAGATALAAQLAPEDLLEVLQRYRAICANVVRRFAGQLVWAPGEQFLAYFGYPQAHEDDPQRAVYAGLGILEAMALLNGQLACERGLRLAVRLGIHTGLVVTGEVGGDATRHPLAIVGETPTIAARLREVAEPNTVVISDATARLVQGLFACQDLGVPLLEGVSTPLQVYGVHGERSVESRFEALKVGGLTPLVGREEELNLVLRRWAQAAAGEGQVVLLAGEAGIGKSRLLEAMCERVLADPPIRLRYQCSPYHHHSAFYPIVTQLARAAGFEPDEPPAQKLVKLEALVAQGTTRVADVTPLLAALLLIPTADRSARGEGLARGGHTVAQPQAYNHCRRGSPTALPSG